LRKLTIDDFEYLSELFKDSDVMEAFEHTFNDNEIKDWYEKQIQRYETNGFGLWAMINKDSGSFLGVSGLLIQNYDEKEYLEIAYFVLKKYWHQGYAIEGAQGCEKYAFEVLKKDKCYCLIKHDNISSLKVAMKLGMHKIGEIIKHYNGKDMLHYIYEKKITKV